MIFYPNTLRLFRKFTKHAPNVISNYTKIQTSVDKYQYNRKLDDNDEFLKIIL